MVLLSELFLCASVPCYVLGNTGTNQQSSDVSLNLSPDSFPAFDEKRELAEVNKSLEDALKNFSTEDKRMKYLKEKLIKSKLKKLRYKYEVNPKIRCLMRKIKEGEGMVRACLTRQALENLERFAFPPALYYDDDLSRYAKWMLALHVYKTPILDEIREKLRTAKLKSRAFACAADNLHSLISSQFTCPRLESYNLPQTQQEIKTFCSFLNKIDLDAALSAELLSDEPGQNVSSTLYKQAAELACWAAFNFPAPFFTLEFEDELCHAPIDWYSAIIIIWDVSEVDQPNVEKYLNAILDENLFRGNVDKLKSERMPLQEWDKKDPSLAKKSDIFNIIFHFVCKPFCELYLPTKSAGGQQKLSNGDYFATEIRERLSNGVGKTAILLSTLTTYVRDVPEKYRPQTTTTTITSWYKI